MLISALYCKCCSSQRECAIGKGKLLFLAFHYAELDNFKFANPSSGLLAAYSCHVVIIWSEFKLILLPLALAGDVMKWVCSLDKYTVPWQGLLRRVQFITQLQAPRAGVPPPPREQHLLPPAAQGHPGLGVWQLPCSVSVLVELAFCWSGFLCRYWNLLSTPGSLCTRSFVLHNSSGS